MANIGISEADSKKIADILHKYLASEIVLNLKIRNFHWNVVGINFNDLHKFFEELYISGS
jgi:starvation-inducible DNA-binding protein